MLTWEDLEMMPNCAAWHGKVYNVEPHYGCPHLGLLMMKYSGKDCSHLFTSENLLHKSYLCDGKRVDVAEGIPILYKHEPGLETVRWWETIEPINLISNESFRIRLYCTLSHQAIHFTMPKMVPIKHILPCQNEHMAIYYNNSIIDLDLSLVQNSVPLANDEITLYCVLLPQ